MAPLYDLASALPYRRTAVDRSLALAIGGQRRINNIRARQWAKAAAALGMPEERTERAGQVSQSAMVIRTVTVD